MAKNHARNCVNNQVGQCLTWHHGPILITHTYLFNGIIHIFIHMDYNGFSNEGQVKPKFKTKQNKTKKRKRQVINTVLKLDHGSITLSSLTALNSFITLREALLLKNGSLHSVQFTTMTYRFHLKLSILPWSIPLPCYSLHHTQ